MNIYTVLKPFYRVSFVSCLILYASCFGVAQASQALDNMTFSVHGSAEVLALGPYITEIKEAYQGTINIIVPKNVIFDGRLKSMPQQRHLEYVYVALDMMQVKPLPDIQHQMFIEADDGQVIAVYADSRIIAEIESQLKPEQRVRWFGYHIYNFSRGPALVIENFDIEGANVESTDVEGADIETLTVEG